MTNLDLSNLNPQQERALHDAYQYIRQRAAWLRSQKITVEEQDVQTQTSVAPNNSKTCETLLSK